MSIFCDSHKTEYRRPFGAARTGSRVHLAIEAPGALRVLLHVNTINEDGSVWKEPMEAVEADGLFSFSYAVPKYGCLIYYFFEVVFPDGRIIYYGNNPERLGGEGAIYEHDPVPYQITVYKPSKVPEWFREGIAYQIFPDRFNRGSDWHERVRLSERPEGTKGPGRLICEDWTAPPFYIKDADYRVTQWPFWCGTLKGIEEKLDYLSSLGVTVLYLNPVFEAASNHRYDTADYMKIDPLLGDDDSFRSLAAAAKERGIHLILDGVFNHTGRDSIYFDCFKQRGSVGAWENPDSPYRSWYHFNPDAPTGYECWWGVPDLPDINENDPSYRDFICGKDGVVRHWLRMGASGWRLDVADELPDNFIREIKTACKAEASDSLLMGEVWEDASNKVSYDVQRMYFMGEELDSTMHYPLRDGLIDFCLGHIDAEAFKRRMMSIYENYPPDNYYSCLNLIGSHDRPRIMSVLGEAPALPEAECGVFRLSEWYRAIGTKRLFLAASMQFAMPGVPCIYYGDEAGMEGLEDPYCRGSYPWGNEDRQILDFYHELTERYQKHPELKSGSFEIFTCGSQCIGIRRTLRKKVSTLIVNAHLTESAFYNNVEITPLNLKWF